MEKKRILFIGELPPKASNGVAYSNKINLDILSEKFEIIIVEEIVNLQLHDQIGWKKLLTFIALVFRFYFKAARFKSEYLYCIFSLSTAGSLKTLLIVLIYRLFNKGKIVMHIHRGDLQNFVEAGKLNRFIFSTIIGRFSHITIVLSESTKIYISQFFHKNIRIRVLSNTIENEDWIPLGDINKPSEKTFIYISNYILGKGILLLLDVFKQLGNGFRLKCYGEYSNKEVKKKMFDFKSVQISINGSIKGKEKLVMISESSALVLPSYNEGKPLVLIEAMAVGTPFIASEVGYIKEMVYDGYEFLYSPNTAFELKKAILKFNAMSREEINLIRNKLRSYYLENYAHKIHKEEVFNIFEC